MDILSLKPKVKKCNKCAKDLPLSEYKYKYSYSGNVCYKCVKEKTNLNNKMIRDKIKESSGDCWWIEQYCYASLYYYGHKKRK